MRVAESTFARGWGFGLALVLLCPMLVRADGGTLRSSRTSHGYRASLFTSPATLRAGPVDFSVLTQAADTDAVLLDVPVQVHVYPAGNPERRIGGPATAAAATNKLFRAIQLDIPEAGTWIVEVEAGTTRLEAEMDVGPPSPSWLELAPWIGWPVGAIALFSAHQWLTRRSRKAG